MLKNISRSFSIASLRKRKNDFTGLKKREKLLTKVAKTKKQRAVNYIFWGLAGLPLAAFFMRSNNSAFSFISFAFISFSIAK
ncbi:MAG: hypothetical protein POELPBGB_00596 [Bacteroidia bacterium]|nr:hypothetical protein [Bacteroidia bacterium]